MFCFNEYSFSRFFLNLYSRRKTTLAWKDELDQIPPADWKLAARRERIIAPLADRDHVTQSEIEQAGEALRLGPAMVFRLLARYRRKRCTSVLVLEPLGRKCGSRILDPSLEKIIQTAIKDFYLRRENHRWQACIEKFGRRVTRPARRLRHTRRFSPAFETSIHGRQLRDAWVQSKRLNCSPL
jgi:hypothetical protein